MSLLWWSLCVIQANMLRNHQKYTLYYHLWISNIHLWSQTCHLWISNIHIFIPNWPKADRNMDACIHFWSSSIHKWSMTTITFLSSWDINSGASELAPRAYRLRMTSQTSLARDFLHVQRKARLLWERAEIDRPFSVDRAAGASLFAPPDTPLVLPDWAGLAPVVCKLDEADLLYDTPLTGQ